MKVSRDDWGQKSGNHDKTKTKVLSVANQQKGKYPNEPIRTQSKTKQTAQSAGKHGRPCRDWCKFVSDWSREWHEFYWTDPRVKLSETNALSDYYRHSIEHCSDEGDENGNHK